MPSSSTVPMPSTAPTQKYYKLSRNLSTVKEVWTEYILGLGAGKPAVNDFEANGTSWRRDPKDPNRNERRYFNKRKEFYNAIEAVALSTNTSRSDVVDALDMIRVEKQYTLDQLRKNLRHLERNTRLCRQGVRKK